MENAATELGQASRYQRNRSKCMWYLFWGLLAVTGIMILIIQPWKWSRL